MDLSALSWDSSALRHGSGRLLILCMKALRLSGRGVCRFSDNDGNPDDRTLPSLAILPRFRI